MAHTLNLWGRVLTTLLLVCITTAYEHIDNKRQYDAFLEIYS